MKCLQLIIASVFLGLCYGSYKLKVMCDDYTTIYYNGVAQKSVAGTGYWNSLATSSIPSSTKEVMIKCHNQNTRYPNGIKAQILNGAGKVVSDTSKGWQCSTSAKSGFKPATVTKQHSNWKSKLSSGAVIWTTSKSHATAYCKVNIAVNGGYGSFGSWGACSAKCEGGRQSRSRKCDNPAPAQGGKKCSGPASQTRLCNTGACPGSLELGKHYTSHQGGDSIVLITGSTNLASKEFDNTMSRYKIGGHETWYFYDKSNYKEPLFTATGPIGWTKVNPRFNDLVSSVKLVRGSLELGKHYTSHQGGDAVMLFTHSSNLAQRGFDNTISRYKIGGHEKWEFYDQPNYKGLLFTATGPIGWTRVNPKYNDKVSSVKLVKEDYTLKVMCDDYTTIYVDGKAKTGVAGTGHWNSLATTKIPASTKTVMIKCHNQNTRYPNGIKVQVFDADGNLVSDTDKFWQCSTSASSGFKPATVTNQHSNWKSKLSSGAVIWTSSKANAVAYCKTNL